MTYRGIVHLELFAQNAVEERQFGRDRRGSGTFLLVRCVDMERSIESAMKSTSTAVLSRARSGFQCQRDDIATTVTEITDGVIRSENSCITVPSADDITEHVVRNKTHKAATHSPPHTIIRYVSYALTSEQCTPYLSHHQHSLQQTTSHRPHATRHCLPSCPTPPRRLPSCARRATRRHRHPASAPQTPLHIHIHNATERPQDKSNTEIRRPPRDQKSGGTIRTIPVGKQHHVK